MLDFSPEKMLFVFLIIMIVLGPEKLPELSRKMGRAVGELRKVSGGFRDEMNKAVHEMSSDTGGVTKPDATSSGTSSGDAGTGAADGGSGT